MNNFISNLERKIGRFAIRNLTLYIIGLYIVGIVFQLLGNFLQFDLTSLLSLIRIYRFFLWNWIENCIFAACGCKCNTCNS